MSERYTNLFRFASNLYTKGSPLIVSAGALQKDNQKNNVFIQIKFTSITNKVINAVKVHLITYDITGSPVKDIADYTYLDLKSKRNEEFGSKSPIILTSNEIRSFDVSITNVVFSDGSIWSADESVPRVAIDEKESLQDYFGNKELVRQYQIETNTKNDYVPIDLTDIWVCSCRTINQENEVECTKCGADKSVLFKQLDVEELNIKKEKRIKAAEEERIRIEKATELERIKTEKATEDNKKLLLEEKALKRKKTTRILKVGIPIFALLIIAIVIYITILSPMIKYNNAIALSENGNFDQAILVLKELGDYNDSEQKILETYYEKGEQFLKEQQYDNAIIAFQSANNFNNADSKILESYYQKGIALQKTEKYVDAKEAFLLAKNFSDATNKVLESYYLNGEALLESGQFDDAVLSYQAATDYSDAQTKVYETYYHKGIKLLQENTFDAAILAFEQAGSFNDAETKVLEAYYLQGENLFRQKLYDEAMAAFTQASDYNNSYERKMEAYRNKLYDQAIRNIGKGTLNTAYQMLSRLPTDFKETSYYLAKIQPYKKYCGQWENKKPQGPFRSQYIVSYVVFNSSDKPTFKYQKFNYIPNQKPDNAYDCDDEMSELNGLFTRETKSFDTISITVTSIGNSYVLSYKHASQVPGKFDLVIAH